MKRSPSIDTVVRRLAAGRAGAARRARKLRRSTIFRPSLSPVWEAHERALNGPDGYRLYTHITSLRSAGGAPPSSHVHDEGTANQPESASGRLIDESFRTRGISPPQAGGRFPYFFANPPPTSCIQTE